MSGSARIATLLLLNIATTRSKHHHHGGAFQTLHQGENHSTLLPTDYWNRTCQEYLARGANMSFRGIYTELPRGWLTWPFVILCLAPCCSFIAPVAFKCCLMHNRETMQEHGIIDKREDSEQSGQVEDQVMTELMWFCCFGMSSVAFTFIGLTFILPFVAVPLLEKLHWRQMNREIFFCVSFPAFPMWYPDYDYDIAFGYYLLWFYVLKLLDDIWSLVASWNDPGTDVISGGRFTYVCFTCICMPIVWCGKFCQYFMGCEPPQGVSVYHYWIVQRILSTYTELAIVITMWGFQSWPLWLGLFLLSSGSFITTLILTGRHKMSIRRGFIVQIFLSDLPMVLGTFWVYLLNRPIDEFIIYNVISHLLCGIRMSRHMCITDAQEMKRSFAKHLDDEDQTDEERVVKTELIPTMNPEEEINGKITTERDDDSDSSLEDTRGRCSC